VPQTDLVTQTDSAAQIAGPAEADPPAPDVRVEPDADRDRDAATARPLRERRRASWTLAALAYAGFVVSAYLTIVHYRGYVSPCYVVQGCETVQTSRYSVVLGVPVALAGALFFGLLFYLAVGLLRRPTLWLVRAFKVLASLGALAMIPLFLLQAIVLKAFCSYCLVTEVLMVSIWIVSFVPTAPERSGGPLEAGAGGE
jgi:uncharacterized membrane protein